MSYDDNYYDELAGSLPPGEFEDIGPEVKCYADLKPEEVRWMWPGRLPFGKLVLLDGDPDVGKSTLLVDLAARITTGSPLPDGYCLFTPFNILLLRGEDGAADTVLPRLLAAKGDPSRFFEIETMPDLDRKGRITRRPCLLPNDVMGLLDVIRRHKIRLVIIDPLMSFLAADINAHRDQDVRRALKPIADVAQITNTCIIAIRHLNKAVGAPGLYRGGGSIGLLAAARLCMVAAHDPENEGRRLVAVYKSNLAEKPETLAYRIFPSALYGCGEICWEGTSALSGADVLHAEAVDSEERSAVSEAMEVLNEILRDGPVSARDVKTQARQAGVAERTLERAKREGGVKVSKEKAKNGKWMWALPQSEMLFDPEDSHVNEPDDPGEWG